MIYKIIYIYTCKKLLSPMSKCSLFASLYFHMQCSLFTLTLFQKITPSSYIIKLLPSL